MTKPCGIGLTKSICETVTISLLDESGSPVKTWEVANAWPKKITVEGFKSDANSPAMETLILAHEGVTVK